MVSLIVMLRCVSLDVGDPATQDVGDARHDLGLGIPFASLDPREVRVADSGGFGESAQAVAALFALPSDFGSIGLHKKDSTQRDPTKQGGVQRDALRCIDKRLLSNEIGV